VKTRLIINDPPYGTERVYNARGPDSGEILERARRSTTDELAVATVEAHKVLVF
jgi:sulfur relay (sulfurtransferase) complex TusBCD TusD component (DsrE family)